MNAPPVAPPIVSPHVGRNYVGWFLLALMFLAIFASTFATPTSTEAKSTELSEAQSVLKAAVTRKGLTLGDASEAKESLLKLEKDAARKHLTDPVAAQIYLAIRFEERKPISEIDFGALKRSSKPIDKAAFEIYSSNRLTLAKAASLSSGLGSLGFLGELMTAHAYKKAGDDFKYHELAQSASRTAILVLGVVAAVGVVSLVGWGAFFVRKSQGELPLLGFPGFVYSARDADRLVLKASQVMAVSFLGLPLLMALFFKAGMDRGVGQMLAALLMVCALPLIFRAPALDRRITLREIGLHTDNLARNVCLGLLAFAMELPVTGILAIVGQLVLSEGKKPTHEATVELMNSHSVWVVISLLALASVFAPFFEEIVFRGLLFPALAKVTKSIPWAGVISSFLFASLHQQGISLWLGLAAVGGMSCLLVVHTKSLVPSIVMHAAHNGTLLMLTLLMS